MPLARRVIVPDGLLQAGTLGPEITGEFPYLPASVHLVPLPMAALPGAVIVAVW